MVIQSIIIFIVVYSKWKEKSNKEEYVKAKVALKMAAWAI